LAIYVALLRGINVGGNNLLPMKDLAALFCSAGCTRVRTYIQSGNVIFEASPAKAAKAAALVTEGIAGKFGFRSPVVLRSLEQLGETIRRNPFLLAGADEKCLHVLFLAQQADAARIATLDPDRSPRDTYAVLGSEIYLHCPSGVGNTKLTNAYFDSRLANISTGRNWRTVLKLFELAQA
jgi:uncharacterized protein (DUF1697 family)